MTKDLIPSGSACPPERRKNKIFWAHRKMYAPVSLTHHHGAYIKEQRRMAREAEQEMRGWSDTQVSARGKK